MKAMPMILGACMLAPLAGGFAGSAISTTPLASAADPLAMIPRHNSFYSGELAATGGPDHFPLVTRHGTIPVEELIFHGALGRRYGNPYAAPYPVNDAAEPVPPAMHDDPAPRPDDSERQRARDIAGLTPVVPAWPAPRWGEVDPLASEAAPAAALVGISPPGQ